MSSDFSPQDEIAELRKEMAQLRQRIAELEGTETNQNAMNSANDPREQAVIDALKRNEGSTFTVNQLKAIYRQSTDVSNDKTLKRRVKQLTERPEFQQAAQPATWRFVGPNGDNTDE